MSELLQIKRNPYTYHGLTVSICPTCTKSVPATIQERDGKMYMAKTCPEHGRFKTIIASDAEWYKQALQHRVPGMMPRQHQTVTQHGCPQDCGVCPEHEQVNALPVIEITDLCNLECPVCYADNKGKYMMTREEMARCLDTLEASGSPVDAIVMVGGEPTAHPRMIELIEQCYERSFVSRVVVATNGILIGTRKDLARRMADVGAYVLFQLDSLDPSKNKLMRGDEMIQRRDDALGMLKMHEIDTTLMAVAVKGLNDDEMGALTKFALDSDFLSGIDIATIAYTGAGGSQVGFDPMNRMTGTDILDDVVAQTGFLDKSDFVPMLHPHPQCGAVSYVLCLDDGSYVPLIRLGERETYRQAMMKSFIVVPDDEHEDYMTHVLDYVWSHQDEYENGEVILRTLKKAADEIFPCDVALTERERARRVEKYIKNIYLHNYMDAHSLDAGALRQCSCMQVLPDGRMIPDCSYRTIHRATDPRFNERMIGHGNDGLRHQLVQLSKRPAR